MESRSVPCTGTLVARASRALMATRRASQGSAALVPLAIASSSIPFSSPTRVSAPTSSAWSAPPAPSMTPVAATLCASVPVLRIAVPPLLSTTERVTQSA
eukprot:Amastigsp_a508890_169.p3 type:complete len:100 gc:universal Amastigsp_a508890_169:742-443(-)